MEGIITEKGLLPTQDGAFDVPAFMREQVRPVTSSINQVITQQHIDMHVCVFNVLGLTGGQQTEFNSCTVSKSKLHS